VWCGPILGLLFFVGFGLIARFIPPPNPANSAAAVAAKYRAHQNSIRLGLEIAMWSGALCAVWVSGMTIQLRRVEGRFSPLTLAQYGLGILLPLEFIIPFYFFMTAAYRSDRNPGEIQTLNDLGWLPFDGLIYTVVAEAIIMGIVILKDPREQPIFPRWTGYMCLWGAIGMTPASFDVFFKNGPLAWNGAIAWWVLVVAFFAWLGSVTYGTLHAISQQERDAAAGEPSPERHPSDGARVDAPDAALR
jgi:hypothetical protein